MCELCQGIVDPAVAKVIDEQGEGGSNTLAENFFVVSLLARLARIAEETGWDQPAVLLDAKGYGLNGPDPDPDPETLDIRTTPRYDFDRILESCEGSVGDAMRAFQVSLGVRRLLGVPDSTADDGRIFGLVLLAEAYERDVPVGERTSDMPPAAEDPRSVQKRYVWFFGTDASESHFVQTRGEQGEPVFVKGAPGAGRLRSCMAGVLISLIEMDQAAKTV